MRKLQATGHWYNKTWALPRLCDNRSTGFVSVNGGPLGVAAVAHPVLDKAACK